MFCDSSFLEAIAGGDGSGQNQNNFQFGFDHNNSSIQQLIQQAHAAQQPNPQVSYYWSEP